MMMMMMWLLVQQRTVEAGNQAPCRSSAYSGCQVNVGQQSSHCEHGVPQAGLHRGARGQQIHGSTHPQYAMLRAVLLSSFGLLADGDAEKLQRVL